MTHEYAYEFDSPDQGCTVVCRVEYEAEPAEYCRNYVLDGQLHIISVKARYIVGYDLEGNDVYFLLSKDLSEGWAEALDLIADAHVTEELNDSQYSCLDEILWGHAGFCI